MRSWEPRDKPPTSKRPAQSKRKRKYSTACSTSASWCKRCSLGRTGCQKLVFWNNSRCIPQLLETDFSQRREDLRSRSKSTPSCKRACSRTRRLRSRWLTPRARVTRRMTKRRLLPTSSGSSSTETSSSVCPLSRRPSTDGAVAPKCLVVWTKRRNSSRICRPSTLRLLQRLDHSLKTRRARLAWSRKLKTSVTLTVCWGATHRTFTRKGTWTSSTITTFTKSCSVISCRPTRLVRATMRAKRKKTRTRSMTRRTWATPTSEWRNGTCRIAKRWEKLWARQPRKMLTGRPVRTESSGTWSTTKSLTSWLRWTTWGSWKARRPSWETCSELRDKGKRRRLMTTTLSSSFELALKLTYTLQESDLCFSPQDELN